MLCFEIIRVYLRRGDSNVISYVIAYVMLMGKLLKEIYKG